MSRIAVAIQGDFKNQGLGNIMLKMTERWLKQQGVERIRLHANPLAVSFYERHGYHKESFIDSDSISKDTVDFVKTL